MKNAIRIGIFTIIVATLVVGYYFYLSHGRGRKDDTPADKSELEKVILADFAGSYPETPREVVKWYNRILKLYYDKETPGDRIDGLCDQALMLFDEDLKKVNPRENYITSVKNEISDYKTRNKKMIQTEVCDSNDVVYKKLGGDSMAYVLTHYVISEGSDYQDTYQKYALRKDAEGKWRIVAFEQTNEDGNAL